MAIYDVKLKNCFYFIPQLYTLRAKLFVGNISLKRMVDEAGSCR